MILGEKRRRASSAGALRRVAVVAVAVMVGTLTLVPAAGASVAPRDRVYASYLPTVEQVSRIYPYLEDGERSVGRYRGLGASFSCWDWTQAFLAADGRWSYYTLKGGAMPYFRGLEDPASFVFKFHTRAGAMDAFWLQKRFVWECMGRHTEDGTTALMWAQQVPAMGEGSVAYRLRERFETANGYGHTRELHISVLRGRYLINVYTQAQDFQPSTDSGVWLTRMTLRNVG
jgi:hypothetical protein